MGNALSADYRKIFEAKKGLLLDTLKALGFPERGLKIVITGCMAAGKTGFYLDILRELWHLGYGELLFKPERDSRYGSYVGTPEGKQKQAIVLAEGEDTLEGITKEVGGEVELEKVRIVAFEEAELFSDKLPFLCERLACLGKLVIVVGLNLNWKGEPFGPMPALMAGAHEVIKLFAKCPICGSFATHTQLFDQEGYPVSAGASEIQMGTAGDKYQPRCQACFLKERVEAGREILPV